MQCLALVTVLQLEASESQNCAKPVRKDCVRGHCVLVAVLVTRNAFGKMLYCRWMLRWVLMWVCPEKEDVAHPKVP